MYSNMWFHSLAYESNGQQLGQSCRVHAVFCLSVAEEEHMTEEKKNATWLHKKKSAADKEGREVLFLRLKAANAAVEHRIVMHVHAVALLHNYHAAILHY
ncbi:hypothetical protein RIF29_41339 [Crotalaria pallida]|uniref:Uncharacterized protein n=1 Tax=Crotalaria pallida TaxID=3830 RepID=A0AAN9E5I5_CROPI